MFESSEGSCRDKRLIRLGHVAGGTRVMWGTKREKDERRAEGGDALKQGLRERQSERNRVGRGSHLRGVAE